MPSATVWGNRPARNGRGMYGRSEISVQPCRSRHIQQGAAFCVTNLKKMLHAGKYFGKQKNTFFKIVLRKGEKDSQINHLTRLAPWRQRAVAVAGLLKNVGNRFLPAAPERRQLP